MILNNNPLGFNWSSSKFPNEISRHSIERVVFRMKRSIVEFVFDYAHLEGNPFTLPEIMTVLDGITVGGRKISDLEQITNLGDSTNYLISLVKNDQFNLSKSIFCSIHALVARNEALEWGHFRGEGENKTLTPDVLLGPDSRYTPIITEDRAPTLNKIYDEGIQFLEKNIVSDLEKGILFFLFGALQQFYFDGNKRTSRMMMNGILMSSGIDAISIPAAKKSEFNSLMVDFYKTKDANKIIPFIIKCHPDFRT